MKKTLSESGSENTNLRRPQSSILFVGQDRVPARTTPDLNRFSCDQLVVVLFLMLLFAAITVKATTITVTSTADNGAGSLRAALAGATNGDTINFSLPTPAKITLTSGELRVSNSVSILGPGPGNLTVDGNAISRVFYIRPSNTVTLASLTVTNGAGGAFGGGGIFNDHSTLAVSNCSFIGNTATHGGGIFNDGRNTNSATLTVVNSVINSNSADGYGGGIFNAGDTGGSATLTVSNCSIIGNSAGNSGGGIDSKGWDSGFASLTVNASTVSSNSAGQFGGGIHNNGEHSGNVAMTVTGSTLNGNSANAGGGINNDSRESGNAIGTVAGCTLNNNTANYVSLSSGGAIYNNAQFSGSATLTVSNCILNSNLANSTAGAIYNDGSGGGSTAIMSVASCTVSGNSSASTGGIHNDGGNSGYAAMTLIASTVSGCSSSNIFSAGAIFNSGNLSVTNCTISSNAASGTFSAGGILNNGSLGSTILTMIASTMSGNSATNSFSASCIYNFIGTVQIGGTIVNGGASATNILHSSGSIISLGYNLSSDGGSGRLTNATDQINTNPMLGALKDNGGPTFTHALLAESPAIDKGKSFGLTTDQRGAPRPFDFTSDTNASGGDSSDIGAFELASPTVNIQTFTITNMTIGWPSYYGDFTLQSTTNVLASNSWANVTETPVVIGNQYVLTNAPISGNRFFRLKSN